MRPNHNAGQVSDWGRTQRTPASNLLGRHYRNATVGSGFAYNNMPGIGGNGASNGTCAQRARFWPIAFEFPTFVRIFTSVQTLESGATMRMGTYNLDENMVPTTLIEDCGTVDASTTGVKSLDATKPLLGWVAIALWASNHSTVRYLRGSSIIAEGGLLFGDSSVYGGGAFYCWGIDSVDYSGGFPSTAPTVTARGLSDNLMMPALRIAKA